MIWNPKLISNSALQFTFIVLERTMQSKDKKETASGTLYPIALDAWVYSLTRL